MEEQMMGPGEGMERESSTIFGVMKINGFQFIKSKVENVGGKSYAEPRFFEYALAYSKNLVLSAP